MDKIELITYILTTCDGLLIKSWWYFEGELPDGSVMSKYSLINDEQNYWVVKVGKEDLSITD